MISSRELAKMKKGVVIVNTARGAVIDEDALVQALDRGHVASCGLDVYEHEPKVHPGLIANSRVMLVPHIGTWTLEVSFATSPLIFGSAHPDAGVCNQNKKEGNTMREYIQLTDPVTDPGRDGGMEYQ